MTILRELATPLPRVFEVTIMPLAVRCPACGRGHKAPDRAAGRTVACMACGAAMKIPQPEPEPPAEPQYSLVSLLDDIPALERSAPPHKLANAPRQAPARRPSLRGQNPSLPTPASCWPPPVHIFGIVNFTGCLCSRSYRWWCCC